MTTAALAVAHHVPPVHRALTIYVTDGIDGVFRVAAMLRNRQYRLRDLQVDVREGVVESRVRCTVLLAADDTCLLVERLNRLPVVVSAGLS